MAKHGPSAEERNTIVANLTSRFTWPIEEEFMREMFEVVSDPARRKHVVYWPRESSGQTPSFGRYLHQMVHALLAEQVHPQFGRPNFAPGTDPSLRNAYRPLFDAALDWYVQAVLMEIAPKAQGDDIDARFKQSASILRQGGALPSLEFVVDTGLAMASFRYWRGLEVEAPGKLGQIVESFVRTDPRKPTLFGMHGLVRSLMAVFGTHHTSLVHDKGFERWHIDPIKKG
ncbi:hypothetical protein [Fundidesulfovibrio agrisoli]|uniref:hypothetical protein n=1 Tax=Fundidesulfovibrio agrisoli TaxID=2922717 RepID=UPI001FAC7194|nr:hypothetical protein [Fundidesulfovibrio agrisoli]